MNGEVVGGTTIAVKHRQEADGPHDGNAEGFPQSQQVVVVRDDELRPGGQRGGQAGIVPIIRATLLAQRQWFNPAHVIQIAVPGFRRSGARGFTLIELLVAVAIIGILAGLLLPALSQGKAAAKATECRNNLRTMAIAMRLYVDDFNAYPPTQGVGIMGFSRSHGWLMKDDWKMQLVPFTGVQDDRFAERADTMRVLRCPQIVSNKDGKRGQGQYALNASGTAEIGRASCRERV